MSCLVSAACFVTEAFGAASPHLPDLNYWWPDGIGTVLVEPEGASRWLPGFLRAISLHPSGCVRLCLVREDTARPSRFKFRPARVESLALSRISQAMPAML